MFTESLLSQSAGFAASMSIGAAEMAQLRCELDARGMREVVAMFKEEGRLRLEQMAFAVARGEVDAVRRSACALREACANFGAGLLASLCAEIERNARRGDLEPAPTLLAHAEVEYRQVELALEQETQTAFRY